MRGGAPSMICLALVCRTQKVVVAMSGESIAPSRRPSCCAKATTSSACSCASARRTASKPRNRLVLAEREEQQGCCSVLRCGVRAARRGRAGHPAYVLNFQDDFARVIDYFVSEYNRGRTPNVWAVQRLAEVGTREVRQAVGADFVAQSLRARGIVDVGRKIIAPRQGPSQGTRATYSSACRATRSSTRGFDRRVLKARSPCDRGRAEAARVHKPDSQEICFVPNRTTRPRAAAARTRSERRVVDTSGNGDRRTRGPSISRSASARAFASRWAGRFT